MSEKSLTVKVVFGRMVAAVVFSPVADIILGLSVLLSFSFFIYGINTLHLTRRARGYSQPGAERDDLEAARSPSTCRSTTSSTSRTGF